MKKLGETNYIILSEAIKECGSYHPDEVFPRCAEQLYITEYDIIKEFLLWVCDGGIIDKGYFKPHRRGFGSGNYEQRFAEFLKTK